MQGDVINRCFVPHLRRSFVLAWFCSHALTGVAIEYRPFGPMMLVRAAWWEIRTLIESEMRNDEY
jgi:hypothetical protein